MRRLTRIFWIIVALVFLLEAWLWDRLEPIVARIVAVIPWRRLQASLAGAIDSLPPTATLVVFIVPVALLIPIKFLGLWLLAHGYWLAAIGTLLLAKLVGLGVTAFVFDVTRDKLLQLVWFHRLYDWVMWLRGWAHALVDPIKAELRAWLLRRLVPIRRRLRRLFWLLKPKRARRFARHLARIRRRMHLAQPV